MTRESGGGSHQGLFPFIWEPQGDLQGVKGLLWLGGPELLSLRALESKLAGGGTPWESRAQY